MKSKQKQWNSSETHCKKQAKAMEKQWIAQAMEKTNRSIGKAINKNAKTSKQTATKNQRQALKNHGKKQCQASKTWKSNAKQAKTVEETNETQSEKTSRQQTTKKILLNYFASQHFLSYYWWIGIDLSKKHAWAIIQTIHKLTSTEPQAFFAAWEGSILVLVATSSWTRKRSSAGGACSVAVNSQAADGADGAEIGWGSWRAARPLRWATKSHGPRCSSKSWPQRRERATFHGNRWYVSWYSTSGTVGPHPRECGSCKQEGKKHTQT